MIKTWRHKGLKELYETGDTRRVRPDLKSRILRRLDRLNVATVPKEMNIPGFNFHVLKGLPQRFTVHVNGPWCVTFGWEGTDALDVDLEQYH
ncbi:MAG TPA: type II toxin-antitoxin system RelE/ParE family toxin [Alphaproteobacteria bacterium]